jgi:alkanesulfonate monooxygenase SsuD/methylene tetrahydromethanopterin reductase-like flavin-dependent oxidoreductase (luciferase family)
MEFGLFVAMHRLDPSEPIQQVYADALEQVRFAEAAGFHVAWFPEHHLSNYIASPHPLTSVTWAAQHTTTIRLGTAVVVLPYYHPLALAEEVGMVDALTDGRLEFGIGRGGYNYEYARFQTSEAEASRRMVECAEAVLRVWGDEDASFEGEFWQFPSTAAVPKPLQRPYPPIWVAARSADTLRWALRHGFDLMAAPQREPFARVEAYVKQLRSLDTEVNGPRRPRLAVSRMTFVSESDSEVLDVMNTVWDNHRINRHLHNGTARVWQGNVQPDDLSPAETLTPAQLIDNLVTGSPEVCIARLEKYAEIGVDQYILQADVGTSQSQIMRSLELFATQVMPHFTRARATAAAGRGGSGHV